MNTLKCTVCDRMVDDLESIELPLGIICLDPCYHFLEDMIEQIEDVEDEMELAFEN